MHRGHYDAEHHLLLANGTSVDYEYVRIKSCGCESCHFNPFELLQETGRDRGMFVRRPTRNPRRQAIVDRLQKARELRGNIRRTVGQRGRATIPRRRTTLRRTTA
jgi:hypothetical protein